MAKLNHQRPKRYDTVFDPKMLDGFKDDAKALTERLAKGHRSPQAHLHGTARVLSEDEKAEIAKRMGWAIK